ncbi:hypothetical protein PHMEG_00037045 [Phytophthora megakarya]|uniref:Polyprotein n=1 Tax=Phytophthora megakarya TaxID=4795 RepID=A0A225UKN1_9STRA|nr:hypothetical protein PHMEG_00037045 [Phytophthora megakarya]
MTIKTMSLNPAHNESFEGNGNSANTPTGSPQSIEGIEAEDLKKITLAGDMWVVDTGAGRAITPDRSWFKSSFDALPKPHLNIGVNKAECLNPKRGLSALMLRDVSYGSKWGSNLLSAYYLAKQGYRHFQSKSGDFLFFIGENFKPCCYLPQWQ